jgi:cytochrome c5
MKVNIGKCFVFFVAMASYSFSYATETSDKLEVQSVVCQDKMLDCLVRLNRETLEASVFRGKVVYHNYCVICHGKDYDGNGRVAKIHNPKPVNLLVSRLPEGFVNDIVRKGGEGVGRYKGMPPFEEQLTEEQLTDVQNFIFSIRVN